MAKKNVDDAQKGLRNDKNSPIKPMKPKQLRRHILSFWTIDDKKEKENTLATKRDEHSRD